MILHSLNESIVQNDAMAWFGDLGYHVLHGPYMVRCLLSPAYYVESAL